MTQQRFKAEDRLVHVHSLVHEVAFSSDSRTLATGGADGVVRFPFWLPLVELALRSAVTQFVEGGLGEAECRLEFIMTLRQESSGREDE
jgi:hypothetical protein